MAKHRRGSDFASVFICICLLFTSAIVEINGADDAKNNDNEILRRVKRIPPPLDQLNGQHEKNDNALNPPGPGNFAAKPLPPHQPRAPVQDGGVQANRIQSPNNPPQIREPQHPQVQHADLRENIQKPRRPSLKKPMPVKIADHPACKETVKAQCSKTSASNNFAVLDCLQNSPKTEGDIPKLCQNFIWRYKRNLTTDIRFDSAASEVCRDVLNEIPECATLPKGTGQIISCLIEHKENMSIPNCKQFLNKMASIVFADYRLVNKFAEACEKDIVKLSCGRVLDDKDDSPHSQGKTIQCLSENIGTLDKKCKVQILRVAEMQADDFHLDRPLFYACRDDRERFCARTKAGSGKVYKCLLRHKFEMDMSSGCREKLTIRQKLMQEDYKVDRSFMDACRHDVIHYKCKEKTDGMPRPQKMAKVLLCLEAKQKMTGQIRVECVTEMRDYRKMLMEDYKISPGIVSYCHQEITENCNGGIEREGKTLHCLMDLARPQHKGNRKFSPQLSDDCQRELKNLLTEADAGEDYRIDRALQEACQPVVDTACKDVPPGDARVLNCLMDKIGTAKMTDDCEERLLEIQYFIARDWKLSPRLYRRCMKKAKELCFAGDWNTPSRAKMNNPSQGHLVIFSCLYQQLKHGKLERACGLEIQRVMRQRAISVDLEPRVEEPCLHNLAEFCSDDTAKGKEIECLQDHLQDLDKQCLYAIGNFTQDEDEDPQLDRILIKACTPMIKEFCEEVINQNTEPGDVMECLIKYKHHPKMNSKCSAGIEHHQLLTLKDYRFSFKFKEACKKDVLKNCKGIKKKADVISCLSENVRNDTLLEEEHRIAKDCRRQLKFELLQRSESIDLDPKLKEACGGDVKLYCNNLTPGQAQVIECLKSHQNKLTKKCHKKLFKRERLEAEDSSIDFALISNCKGMIKQFCKDTDPKDMFTCLKRYKNNENFDTKCRKMVLKRMMIQSKDYRLNPTLQKACKLDIPKFCSAIITAEKNDEELEGKVVNCLKEKFRINRLSRDCEDNIRSVMKEAALDYRQDPLLARACQSEITKFCGHVLSRNSPDDTKGKVEECLKLQFKKEKIQDKNCQKEILRLLTEGKSDVHVDPLLNQACALDLKHYCFNVPPGEGRQMSCLLAALEDKTIRLDPGCNQMLRDRVEMWEYAAKVAPPETVQELVAQITTSPAKNYFIGIIFAVIGTIFIGGLFCGRVTKRVRAEMKNK
ncbi:Golgi apparatus protein 1-like isoform X2 [Lineus longissimus]|uniref:Golgi apparatus protein 1-like isoform X2 n=1 Tax=Lineus longissimus TaxID=88925 RepID=UPI00315D69B8